MRDIYFNQMDIRWKNKIYSSTGNTNQTLGSSGCGPTSLAMLISSFRGDAFPYEVADDLVANGHRTANDGTAWSAFSYIAEKYGFDYFETDNITEVINTLNKGGLVIASCGAGVFSTGGHIILLNSMRDTENITVYDPALYSGKYNAYGRADKVWIEDIHNVNISIDNIEKYGNVQRYFCYTDNQVQPKPYVHTVEQDIKDLKVSLCASYPDCDLDYSNGEFDEATKRAVKRHPIKEGDSNAYVNWMKDMLKSYAYDIEPNNNFDSYTANMVELFQLGNGLKPNKEIDLDDVICLLDY